MHNIQNADANYLKPKEIDLSNWHHKDYQNDTILGVSIEKAYDFLKGKKAEEIIIAVLDSEINIDHPAIKNQIWTNKNEIPNNNLDDDHNGYIDDIHGWNFIGTKLGDDLPIRNYEFTRYVKFFNKQFLDKKIEDIPTDSIFFYRKYETALEYFNSNIDYCNTQLKRYKDLLNKCKKADSVLNRIFTNEIITIKKLDSLLLVTSDTVVKSQIDYKKVLLRYRVDQEYYHNKINRLKTLYSKQLNLDYDDRLELGNRVNDISDINYGNNNVKGTGGKMNHAIRVTSLIAANRNLKDSVRGILNNTQIMCLNIFPEDDVFDKDIVLAIRYAVDNGAKVINMSFTKEFPIHKEWLKDAVLYAARKDVLLVSGSGNDGINLDNTLYFPNDSYDGKIEFANNLIKVGASSYKIDSTLVASFSNYGKREVDIFAPGKDLHTIWDEETIDEDSGASLATAITTGVTALIRSYYPNLTAPEVKNIILKSGVSLDILVNKPVPYGEETEKVPFSSLSKSGKIVNAYNALVLAEKVSKQKKRKKK